MKIKIRRIFCVPEGAVYGKKTENRHYRRRKHRGVKIHFEEVKRIFVGIEYLCVITLILSCFLIKRKIRSRNIDFLRSASIITVLLPVIVGILCAFNWDAAFTLFHEIMFRNDYWIFDPDIDPVINILPEDIFFHIGILILAIVFLTSILLQVSYRRLKKNFVWDFVLFFDTGLCYNG